MRHALTATGPTGRSAGAPGAHHPRAVIVSTRRRTCGMRGSVGPVATLAGSNAVHSRIFVAPDLSLAVTVHRGGDPQTWPSESGGLEGSVSATDARSGELSGTLPPQGFANASASTVMIAATMGV